MKKIQEISTKKLIKKSFLLGKKLFPICRSITGKGTLKTLKILKTHLKALKIKKIKSGTKIFDWKVPDEWNIDNAYILDKNNKKIIDFKKNNLHIVNYSRPTNLHLNRDDLLKKIYSLKEIPNAIPYVTSYYHKHWGFCETYINKKKIKKEYLPSDKFKVHIGTSFKKNGYMNYGEFLIKGVKKEEILISTYVCHPSMANNELSGPLVSLALANYFKKRKPYYGIRFLFLPETIGSIAYINKNLENLKKKIIGGYVLTCVGDNRAYSYQFTKYMNSISDIAAVEAFKKAKIKYKSYTFLKRGSDERQYNSPGVDLNIGSIMRSKPGTYKEYHTSLDNFNVINIEGLTGGFNISKLSIENILKMKNLKFLKREDNNKKKGPMTSVICEPHLSKRNLYRKMNFIKEKNKNRKYLDFLQYSDGSNTLVEISKYINCTMKQTRNIRKILKKAKLVN